MSVLRRLLIFVLLAAGLGACLPFTASSTPTPAPPTDTPLPPTPTPPPSAAVVNGEYITLVEFQAELGRYQAAQSALGTTVSEADANQAVLEDLIAQVLLSQGARQAGFVLTDADLKARIDSLTAQIGGAPALAAWQAAHGYDEASFEAALRRSAEAAWMRDSIIANVQTTTEQIHIRQILTYNEADARTMLDQIRAGTDFDELAAQADPATQGELGWVPPGTLLLDAKADEALFALQAGAVSEVIASDSGFHIFKIIERGPHPLSPDALLSVQEKALKDWLAARRAESSITLAP